MSLVPIVASYADALWVDSLGLSRNMLHHRDDTSGRSIQLTGALGAVRLVHAMTRTNESYEFKEDCMSATFLCWNRGFVESVRLHDCLSQQLITKEAK